VDVTIVIATYGERSWLELTMQRAAASAFDTGAATIVVHGLTLHGARNAGLAQVQTEHVIFLDADDELEAGYLEAMAAGNADLRAPAVRYMRPTGRAHEPYVPRVCGHTHDCAGDCLPHGNWLVIGTCARTALVRAAGGFRDFSWSEDWDLWLRCWRAGATVEALPAAVYRAHMRADSRNRAPDRAAKLAAHEAIYQANYGEAVSA
jgi:glycosyltransferase involved in cell wall biosynthesis